MRWVSRVSVSAALPREKIENQDFRPARIDEADILMTWGRGFQEEADPHAAPKLDIRERITERLKSGSLFVWEDDEPVSMSAAVGPTPHGIRIGYVYTPPGKRRRGYAAACVAALTQRMLDEGRDFCFLYTDMSNDTSNGIYRRIGYEWVCGSRVYSFPEQG